ncbi:MAG: Asp-tRNA(Asn)/Glu-tRNA(Gln) amidotransferase subunit GatC [Kiritimatiellia bacterium]|nr:Asp-tRNA(Asn)/Glu-tRNA(Gln) amidotransferase subunit GatC [Kiritimatiellia bacterium]
MKSNHKTIDVAHIARLARIGLREEEVPKLEEQLGRILTHVDRILAIDVSEIEPMAHAVAVQNVFREDMPSPVQPRERTLENAPATRDGLFIVPRILE